MVAIFKMATIHRSIASILQDNGVTGVYRNYPISQHLPVLPLVDKPLLVTLALANNHPIWHPICLP